MPTREDMFRDLRDRDPDGWEVKPLAKDYENFKIYAVTKYGEAFWRRYRRA